MAEEGLQFTCAATTVNTSFTTIGSPFVLKGRSVNLAFEVDNPGAAALSDFKLQLKDHVNGDFYDYLSGTDWQASNLTNLHFSSYNATGPVPGPNTTGAGGKAHAQVRINGVYAFRFQAKVASGTSAGVTVRGIYGKE